MKCENTVKIGDVVKSYDFVSSKDCYYVGFVTEIMSDEGMFRAKVVKRVWESRADLDNSDEYFSAPLPGSAMMDDLYPNRIEVIA